MCWRHIVTFLWALTAVIRAQVPVHAPKVVPKGVPQPPTPHWGWDIDQGVRLAPPGAHLDVQPSLAPHAFYPLISSSDAILKGRMPSLQSKTFISGGESCN